MKYLISCLFFLFILNSSFTQSGYHFGVKGGLSLASQNWNNSERRFLLTNHVNLFIESRDPDDKGSLFAQIGYHTRGSSIRISLLNAGFDDGYTFKNASLLIGAKRKTTTFKNTRPYYFMGLRAEYNLNHNLEDIILRYCTGQFQKTTFPFPIPGYVNKFTYGISIGGGFEFSGSKFFNPALEFTLSPDLSYQYDAPEDNTGSIGIPQSRIRNITFEISLVLRFLREIVYEDR